MNGQYPRFKNSYFYEELTENFLLTPAELEFVRNCRRDVNRQGMAILLKGLQYLGYFPESLEQVPGSIRSFMGKQLGLLTDFINQYPWETTVGKMAHSIKLEIPDALILVGLWSLPTEGAARWVRKIKESSGSALYTNIEQAIRGIASLVPQVGEEL
jgi:hypothetical protein